MGRGSQDGQRAPHQHAGRPSDGLIPLRRMLVLCVVQQQWKVIFRRYRLLHSCQLPYQRSPCAQGVSSGLQHHIQVCMCGEGACSPVSTLLLLLKSMTILFAVLHVIYACEHMPASGCRQSLLGGKLFFTSSLRCWCLAPHNRPVRLCMSVN
jgi:hypothetical protein